MRVLYVIDSLFPGGAARSMAAMVPNLLASGVQLEVAYLVERPGLHAQLAEAGARVTPLGGASRPSWWGRAAGLARRRRPDLIHTTLAQADLAGRIAGFLSGFPVVSSIVNLAYGPEQLSDPGLARWKVEAARLADSVTARAVTRFHVISRDIAEVMGGRLRIRPDRIDVVPRGRDPAELGTRSDGRRKRARSALGLDGSEVLLLAAARQEYQKGLDVLLEAFPLVRARVPGARLALAGRPGGATALLERQAAAAGPSVRMLGVRDDVPDLLCAADAFVLPSRWEGLGGVLLEAMALEAPIVASDLPAVREVIGDGRYGRLAPPDRPEALAEAIVATVRDSDGTSRRAKLARRRYLDEYTIDRIAPRMMAFYERALSQAGRGPRPAAAVRP
jgi:glycosyltransferase involved in cell wall biosynthesis